VKLLWCQIDVGAYLYYLAKDWKVGICSNVKCLAFNNFSILVGVLKLLFRLFLSFIFNQHNEKVFIHENISTVLLIVTIFIKEMSTVQSKCHLLFKT
jgi:hypothetical protein